MRIAVFGGSFNPPHPGHVRAARAACEALRPDKLIVIPAADPPHKALPACSPGPEERLYLTRLAFSAMPEAEVSDIEILRSGESYTADTVAQLQAAYPGADIILIVGTDMLLYFEKWNRFRWLLNNVTVAALSREDGDSREISEYSAYLREEYGANVLFVDSPPLPMSSSQLRELLRARSGADVLAPEVYGRIIKTRDYGAKPQFSWLREHAYGMLKPGRIAHVKGCEAQAVSLARRWGADADSAAEAAILHDITKKLVLSEQLLLCGKYGIIVDSLEAESAKLLHARTGAALARDLFGIPDDIYDAIRWHTTGRPAMALLEKIIYLADYIEPNRDFEELESLRRLSYTNIDEAMALGLKLSLKDLRAYDVRPHGATVSALEYYEGAAETAAE
ncbi:MAG TPA: nicotinate (nicotinamide) nucleotide adenylyltransferase [Clostridiales bacterium]|nr:nicotinate (nicotinamide) nucleotide adenylyltransferase [Clostridiales bacterium]HBR08208.1 nicotinate (nicotinamide) nucleotide adenylyltransferase [Clostridiales bacterium]